MRVLGKLKIATISVKILTAPKIVDRYNCKVTKLEWAVRGEARKCNKRNLEEEFGRDGGRGWVTESNDKKGRDLRKPTKKERGMEKERERKKNKDREREREISKRARSEKEEKQNRWTMSLGHYSTSADLKGKARKSWRVRKTRGTK